MRQYALTAMHMSAGPNPTHQMHITFFWIWMWLLHTVKLATRQVHLLVDCDEPQWCMGTYGIGLAKALLSDPIWMPQSAEPIAIDEVKFGMGGTFPYSLWEMQPVGLLCISLLLYMLAARYMISS